MQDANRGTVRPEGRLRAPRKAKNRCGPAHKAPVKDIPATLAGRRGSASRTSGPGPGVKVNERDGRNNHRRRDNILLRENPPREAGSRRERPGSVADEGCAA